MEALFMETVLQSGMVCVPHDLLLCYREVGLTEEELVLLLILSQCAQRSGDRYPDLGRLARVMGREETQVQEIVASLVEKECLGITKEHSPENGASMPVFTMEPLLRRIGEKRSRIRTPQRDACVREQPSGTAESKKMDIYGVFEREFGRLLSNTEIAYLSEWLAGDGFGENLVLEALRSAVSREKRSFRYIDAILRDWQRKGIRTPPRGPERGPTGPGPWETGWQRPQKAGQREGPGIRRAGHQPDGVGMSKRIDQKIQEIRDLIGTQDGNGIEGEPQCPVCKDRGLVFQGGVARVCQCEKTRNMQRQLRNARLTGEYCYKRFSDFSLEYYTDEAVTPGTRKTYRQLAEQCKTAGGRFVREVAEKREGTRGLYLYGNVGSGKTLLASCIANELLAQGAGVLFVSVPDLLDEIRDTFHNGNTSEMTLLSRIRCAPVLVMDDLGAHAYTDWVAGRIYHVINYRASHYLPTVITSNLSVSDLQSYIDERTSSRILQFCRLYMLSVSEDIRRQRYRRECQVDSPRGI